MTRIFVTRRWPDEVEAHLRDRFAANTSTDDRPLTEAELLGVVEHVEVLCPTVSDRIGARIIDHAASCLKLICNYGAGLDHIDLDACRARGIVVTNTPDILSDATAELALTLMLMLARRAGEGERELRGGGWHGWRPTHLLGTTLSGKTLGLVGFGRIAQALAAKAAAGFGMRVIYHARRRAVAAEAGCQADYCAALDDLLATSDVVSLHCPGGAVTDGLIGAAQLRRMKSSAFLINTARGTVIDEAALVEALEERRIAGAGLDVFRNEPAILPALLEAPNTVLLPHLGSATRETRVAMGMRAVANLEAWLSGQPPGDRVA